LTSCRHKNSGQFRSLKIERTVQSDDEVLLEVLFGGGDTRLKLRRGWDWISFGYWEVWLSVVTVPCGNSVAARDFWFWRCKKYSFWWWFWRRGVFFRGMVDV